MQNFKLSKYEQGRSMVEMLGVLAVIGVLSVAGIAGYTTAMRSYRANEIVNAASMLYVMAQARNQGNGADTNYTELGTPPSGVTLEYSASTKAISITFDDEKDCVATKNKVGDKAEGTCAKGSSTLTVKLEEAGAPTPSGPTDEEVDSCFAILGGDRVSKIEIKTCLTNLQHVADPCGCCNCAIHGPGYNICTAPDTEDSTCFPAT